MVLVSADQHLVLGPGRRCAACRNLPACLPASCAPHSLTRLLLPHRPPVAPRHAAPTRSATCSATAACPSSPSTAATGRAPSSMCCVPTGRGKVGWGWGGVGGGGGGGGVASVGQRGLHLPVLCVRPCVHRATRLPNARPRAHPPTHPLLQRPRLQVFEPLRRALVLPQVSGASAAPSCCRFVSMPHGSACVPAGHAVSLSFMAANQQLALQPAPPCCRRWQRQQQLRPRRRADSVQEEGTHTVLLRGSIAPLLPQTSIPFCLCLCLLFVILDPLISYSTLQCTPSLLAFSDDPPCLRLSLGLSLAPPSAAHYTILRRNPPSLESWLCCLVTAWLRAHGAAAHLSYPHAFEALHLPGGLCCFTITHCRLAPLDISFPLRLQPLLARRGGPVERGGGGGALPPARTSLCLHAAWPN